MLDELTEKVVEFWDTVEPTATPRQMQIMYEALNIITSYTTINKQELLVKVLNRKRKISESIGSKEALFRKADTDTRV